MGGSSPSDFRAPPPSPVASSRRASFTANEDVLTEFLDKCGRVPNLVLPDKVFPKHRFLENPPTLDYLHLGSLSSLLDALSTFGCFQLINHDIPEAMVRAAMDKAIFKDETEDLLVVHKDNDDDACCYSDIRALMDEAERIGKSLRDKLGGRRLEDEGIEVCYVKKHTKSTNESEAIRMLIRGYDERHSLCLSFCNSSEFHVYSKRGGWLSFNPRPDALVVTVGDQGWNGMFKGVVGRPFLYHHHGQDVLTLQPNYNISLSFLYTTLSNNTLNEITDQMKKEEKERIISLSQQLLVALIIILLFSFFLH